MNGGSDTYYLAQQVVGPTMISQGLDLYIVDKMDIKHINY
jgi:hypothetical protein